MELDFVNWMLVFVRASAFLMILPLFSTPNIPVQVRVGLGALLAFLIAPTLPPFPFPHPTFLSLIVLFAAQATCGLVIGFISRMVFYAADLAGTFIASEMGLSLANTINPGSGQPTQAPGMILFFLTAVVMMTLNLHHELLIGFQRSFVVLPIGGLHVQEGLFYDVLRHTRDIFIVAMEIAAPLIATSYLVLLIFSVLGRAAPQVNVFTESFGVRILAGMAVFGLTLQISAQYIVNYLRRLPLDIVRVAQLLGGH